MRSVYAQNFRYGRPWWLLTQGLENLPKLPDKTAHIVFKSLLIQLLLSTLDQRGALLTYMLTA